MPDKTLAHFQPSAMSTTFQSIVFVSLLSLISTAAYGQNKLDVVAQAIEKGDYNLAINELETLKKTVKVALPPRAYKYEFDICYHFHEIASTHADRVHWFTRMVATLEQASQQTVTNEFLPEMQQKLMALHSGYRKTAAGLLLEQKTDEFLPINDLYILSGLAVGEQMQHHVYQSAEFAKLANNLPLAIRHYQQAVALDFEAQLAYANWISLLRVQRLREKADTVLMQATLAFPESNIDQLVKALENYEKKLYFTALKEVEASLLSDPENHTLHYLLGLINLKTDRVDVAVDGFHRVEELVAESYLTNYQLGKYYMHEGITKQDAGALSIAGFSLSQCESMQRNDLFLYQTILTFCEAVKDEKNATRIRALLMN